MHANIRKGLKERKKIGNTPQAGVNWCGLKVGQLTALLPTPRTACRLPLGWIVADKSVIDSTKTEKSKKKKEEEKKVGR
jgi:hypothetical protein